MARISKRMSLYEAVNREKLRASQKRTIERLVPFAQREKPPQPPVNTIVAEKSSSGQTAATQLNNQSPNNESNLESVKLWRLKPKIIQFMKDRVEFSVNYQALAVAGFVLILLLLVAYKLGQKAGRSGSGREAAVAAAGQALDVRSPVDVAVSVNPEPVQRPSRVETTDNSAVSAPGGQIADHIILIASVNLPDRRNLEPVQRHFEKIGIQTQIRRPVGSNKWVLVTTKRFADTSKPGSEGAVMLQRIKEHGLKYQTPAGYDGFGQLFQDAYIMKVVE